MKTMERGQEIGRQTLNVTRADLVRYAGAILDFHPIHWNERFATGIGLPGVVAHGTLTMALAGKLLTEWSGDPGKIRNYSVHFLRPLVVPDDDQGALVEFSAKIIDTDNDTATVSVSARHNGEELIGRATAKIQA